MKVNNQVLVYKEDPIALITKREKDKNGVWWTTYKTLDGELSTLCKVSGYIKIDPVLYKAFSIAIRERKKYNAAINNNDLIKEELEPVKFEENMK